MPDEAARQAQVAVNLQASLMKNEIVVGLARLMEGGRGRVFRVDHIYPFDSSHSRLPPLHKLCIAAWHLPQFGPIVGFTSLSIHTSIVAHR